MSRATAYKVGQQDHKTKIDTERNILNNREKKFVKKIMKKYASLRQQLSPYCLTYCYKLFERLIQVCQIITHHRYETYSRVSRLHSVQYKNNDQVFAFTTHIQTDFPRGLKMDIAFICYSTKCVCSLGKRNDLQTPTHRPVWKNNIAPYRIY